MIEIRTITVRNFRSFTDAQFAPLGAGQGVTAVNGANGVGKSSIATHALLWALYGVTPGGVPVKALRQEGSDGDVEVCVEFTHDGQIVCVTRALRGKKDTTTAAITVDGVEQTNVSSRTATTWVTQRLQANAEAFTAAFVVRQKELDALVRARPAERRAVIERLAGIDRMSEALTRAREKARHHKTIADNIHVPVPENQARQYLEEARAAHDSAQEALHQANTRHDTAVVDAETSTTEHATLTSAHHEWSRAEQGVQRARATHTANCEALQRAQEAAAEADMLADLQSTMRDIREQRDSSQEAVRALTTAQERHATARTLEQTLRQRHGEKTQALTQAAQKETTARETFERHPEVTDAQIEQATRLEREAQESLGAAAAEEKRLHRAILMLTDHQGGHAAAESSPGQHTCPTCQQTVHDVAGLRELLSEQLDAAKSRHTHAQETLTRASEEAQRVRENSQQQHQLAQALERAATAVAHAAAAADETEQELRDAERGVEETSSDLAAAQTAAQQAEEQLAHLAEEEARVGRLLRRAEAAAEAAAELPQLQESVAASEEELTAAEQHAAALTPVTDEEVSAAWQRARAHDSAAAEAAADATRAQAQTQITAADLAARERDWETAKANEEAKTVALREAEQAAAVAAALDEFRRDRIARLAPELSETASDLLQTMTEGRFSTVELDEDFTPIVTESATGEQRPVAWLSGGEESAVALALRLAIGEVVTGQRVGLLALDEVLTAQDASRRAAVMGAIRSIPHRQVIVINHVSEATDMVDLVAWVQRDDSGNVTIEHAAPEPSVGDLTHIE